MNKLKSRHQEFIDFLKPRLDVYRNVQFKVDTFDYGNLLRVAFWIRNKFKEDIGFFAADTEAHKITPQEAYEHFLRMYEAHARKHEGYVYLYRDPTDPVKHGPDLRTSAVFWERADCLTALEYNIGAWGRADKSKTQCFGCHKVEWEE